MIKATYIDHMGSDLSVVNAARVSFGKKSHWEFEALQEGLQEKDAKLIRYLAKHNSVSWLCAEPQPCQKLLQKVRRMQCHLQRQCLQPSHHHLNVCVQALDQNQSHSIGHSSPILSVLVGHATYLAILYSKSQCTMPCHPDSLFFTTFK